jgi:signal transduction histidine kinase
MLGHDMRSPLQTIKMTAQFLATLHVDERIDASAHHLMCAGARMQALLDDLVDFNRTRLGLGIRIHPAPTDLAVAFRDEVEQLCSAHRDRRITLAIRGDCAGHWDAMRLRQVLANLVANAVRHGGVDGEIEVELDGDKERLRFEVRNHGPTLPVGFLEGMFDPLRSGDRLAHDDAHSLGLGLYISREITLAHGGAIAAHSHEGLTCFTVELPRDRRADPRHA